MQRRAALLLLFAGRLPADSYGDGLPDSLRLSQRADQEAFRAWFAWLAESLWASQPAIPREVNDCAALLRFCCREALRAHTAEWARQLGLDQLPPLADVRQYNYPVRELRGALFRVRPGPWQHDDTRNGAFREFADAEHLMRFNAHALGRDLSLARPADLLFYKQLDDMLPWHSMIVARGHAVYHTGPIGGARGEIRRATFDALLNHPEPRWRPLRGNSNFLGVFRWNLLRDPT